MTQMQRNALIVFAGNPSLLYDALSAFIAQQSAEWRKQCAAQMATVPRNPELASDFAARAAAFDEFWPLLEFAIGQEDFAAEPTR